MKLAKLSLLVFTVFACTLSMAVCAQAQTLTTLAEFKGNEGWLPFNAVIQATDGNFYGTTSEFDPYESLPPGNVFRVTPAGVLKSIYTFCSQPHCADGAAPSALVLGGDGNLYGTTGEGGSSVSSRSGSGTIFKMTLGGAITTLYTFCTASPCQDGEIPTGLILASDGNFYGTAIKGGALNDGTLFRISPTGEFKVLYSFCSAANCADGAYPEYPPIQGTDGNFYGTTYGGGTAAGGVAYKLTPSGTYTVLYNFCNSDSFCPDGDYLPTLTQGANGNFYGITETGGANGNGVVFELTSTGEYSVLQNVPSYPVGNYTVGYPVAPLTFASDGNLYGVLGGGGPGFWAPPTFLGDIFEITSAGLYRQFTRFEHQDHQGYGPFDSLFQATNGSFYGTTGYGGVGGGAQGNYGTGQGTVFQFSNGLGPLVETVPVAGPVGQSILILGNNLTGSTSVKFNGVEADFTVESDTYIKATVPKGATTGPVSVVTPSATLNSNPQFVVTK